MRTRRNKRRNTSRQRPGFGLMRALEMRFRKKKMSNDELELMVKKVTTWLKREKMPRVPKKIIKQTINKALSGKGAFLKNLSGQINVDETIMKIDGEKSGEVKKMVKTINNQKELAKKRGKADERFLKVVERQV